MTEVLVNLYLIEVKVGDAWHPVREGKQVKVFESEDMANDVLLRLSKNRAYRVVLFSRRVF